MADLKLTPVAAPGTSMAELKPSGIKEPTAGFGQVFKKAIDSVNNSKRPFEIPPGPHGNQIAGTT